MKIRGNTVGTPIKPKKVLVKSENLTEEEKALARANIGAAAVIEDIDYSVYFDITDDGLISLKPEYRADGSQNKELPEVLVIPDVVNDVAVTELTERMFENNIRIKSLTIPKMISIIPKYFVSKAFNLAEINGIENIEVIGQGAFQMVRIKKALFPKLKRFDGIGQFNAAPYLAIVDIGDTVTTIPKLCFGYCEKLSVIRGGAKVTEIGEKAFFSTRNLKNLPIVANVKSIGASAFELSRVSYDWWTFKNTSGCTFGNKATPAHYNPTDWWSGCTWAACENQLGSTFSQKNPEWAEDNISNSSDTYGSGCLEISAAHVYSALMDVELDSPKYFVENIVGAIGNGSLLAPTGGTSAEPEYTFADMATWLTALGLQCEVLDGGYNAVNLQKVYDALGEGALILTYINPSHAGVLYGISSNGEVWVLDSDSIQHRVNAYKPGMHKIAIQNLTVGGGGIVIVKKGG